MMQDAQRYPLHWPHWRKRTPDHKRRYGNFSTRLDRGYASNITLHQATKRVISELDKYTKPGKTYRVDMDNIIISSNLPLRRDNLPGSGQKRPDDPGVAVWFELDGEQRCVPVDEYTTVEQNMAAVAACLSALRTIERHGSGLFEAAFDGFTALPGPDVITTSPWYVVLDVQEDADREVVTKSYYKLRSVHHPDNGGSTERFNEVNRAFSEWQDLCSR